mmetsp:Transcript_13911/g.24872  ORF Transcript_13911/g.24872 Transcript_13911/m.24872 type:complete len:1828 (+) Transcript_13911:133-5616(+)
MSEPSASSPAAGKASGDEKKEVDDTPPPPPPSPPPPPPGNPAESSDAGNVTVQASRNAPLSNAKEKQLQESSGAGDQQEVKSQKAFIAQSKVIARAEVREKSVNEKFPWSEHRSNCEEVLEAFAKFPACIDFLSKPNFSDFKGYNDFVEEPFWINLVSDNIKAGKITSVTNFIRQVRQVFINALRYWIGLKELRTTIYLCLNKFHGLLKKKLPAVLKLLRKNRLTDEEESGMTSCRDAIDHVLETLLKTPLLFAPGHGKLKKVADGLLDFNAQHVRLVDIVSRLNGEKYLSVDEFYGETCDAINSFLRYFRHIGKSAKNKNVKDARQALTDFMNTMKSVVSTTAQSKYAEIVSDSPIEKERVEVHLLKQPATLSAAGKKLLDKVKSADKESIFQIPVDPVALNISDYFSVIEKPMDFGTIRKKLSNGAYTTVQDFIADCEQVFWNCETYNVDATSNLRIYCKALKAKFEKFRAELLDPLMSQGSSGSGHSSAVEPKEEFGKPVSQKKLKVNSDPVEPAARESADAPADVSSKKKKKKKKKTMSSESFPEASAVSQALHTICKMKEAQGFLEPVPWEKFPALNDYPLIIKKPMDFGTIASNLAKGKYTSLQAAKADVDLVFTNCRAYNSIEDPQFPIVTWSHVVEKKFEKELQRNLALLKVQNGSSTSLVSAPNATVPETSQSATGTSPAPPLVPVYSRSSCQNILNMMKSLPAARLFFSVDFKTLPGYTDEVEHPIDLKKVTQKLKQKVYTSFEEFANDVRLVFKNSLQYSKTEPRIRKFASELLETFEDEYRKVLEAPPKVKKKVKVKLKVKAQAEARTSEVSPPGAVTETAMSEDETSPKVKKKKKKKKKDKYKDKKDRKSDAKLAQQEVISIKTDPIRKKKIKIKSTKQGDLVDRVMQSGKAEARHDSGEEFEGAPPPPPPPPGESGLEHMTIKVSTTGGKRKFESDNRDRAYKRRREEVQSVAVPSFDPPPAPRDNELRDFERTCNRALLKLGKTEWGGTLFGRPVLESFPDLHDAYTAVISNPIDLRTILEQLYSRQVYSTASQIDADVQQMFQNAFTFNSGDDLTSQQLKQKFEHCKMYWDHLYAERVDGEANLRNQKRQEREMVLAQEELTPVKSLTSKLMKKLIMPRNKDALPFLDPVDTNHFTDYTKIIDKPMDLSTVKRQVEEGVYNSAEGITRFAADMRLIFSNCLQYNTDIPSNSYIRGCAERMSNFFETEWGLITCDAVEKVEHGQLEFNQAVQRDVEHEILVSGDSSPEFVKRITEEITHRHDKERKRIYAERKARRRGPVKPGEKSALNDTVEESGQFSYEEVVDDSDDEDFSPAAMGGGGSSGGASRQFRASGTVHLPTPSPTQIAMTHARRFQEERERRFHQPDSYEYKKFLSDLEKVKDLSLKRTEVLALEQKEITEREKRRKEREENLAQELELEGKETERMSFLSPDDISKIHHTRLVIHPIRKRRRFRIAVPASNTDQEEDCALNTDSMELEEVTHSGSDELASQENLSWQKRLMAKIEQQIKESKTAQPINVGLKTEEKVLSGVRISCPIPRSLTRCQKGLLLACEPSLSLGAPSPMSCEGSPRPNQGPAQAGKRRSKGKQITNLLATVTQSVTAQVAQRVLDFNGVKLCFGSILMTFSKREEDLRREQRDERFIANNQGGVGSTPHPSKGRRILVKAGSGDVVSKPVPVLLSPEHKELVEVSLPIEFKSNGVTKQDLCKFKRALGHILTVPTESSRSGDLRELGPQTMVARRFIEGIFDMETFHSQTGLDKNHLEAALCSWQLHDSQCLLVCKPEMQERRTRAYAILRFVGLADKLEAYVNNMG